MESEKNYGVTESERGYRKARRRVPESETLRAEDSLMPDTIPIPPGTRPTVPELATTLHVGGERG